MTSRDPLLPAAPGSQRPGKRHDTPFGVGVPLGRWAGVPIYAHWTVLVTITLFADILATSQLPAARAGQGRGAYWVAGVVTAVVFLVTLLAHELAHAITARHYGMRVQRITLWMLGGLTELDGEPPSPRADALIAASGPLTSLGIGGGCLLLAVWVGTGSLTGAALAWLAAVSILLGVFNLLPGAPLDGGRLLRALLWWRTHDRTRAARGAARAGRVVGIGLVALGFLEVLAGNLAGLWLALIGWFVMSGAASENYAARGDKLRGLTARDVMSGPPAVAPEWWTVQQFLDRLPAEHAKQPAFPLVDVGGQVTGIVTVRDLDRVPQQQRDSVRLRALGGRNHAPVIAYDSPLPDLLLSLHLRGGIGVVVDHDRPIGIITDADLQRAVQLAELGWPGRQAGPTNTTTGR